MKKKINEATFLNDTSDTVKEVYDELKILSLGLDDNIKLFVQKDRISFSLKRKPVVKVRPLKKKLRVWFTLGSIPDEEEDDDQEETTSIRKKNYIDLGSTSELQAYKQNFSDAYKEVVNSLI